MFNGISHISCYGHYHYILKLSFNKYHRYVLILYNEFNIISETYFREPFECKAAETDFKRPNYPRELANKTEKCECENFRFQCSKYASGIPPTQLQLNTTDFLQDLNSKSMPVSEYLLESYTKFIKKRYI